MEVTQIVSKLYLPEEDGGYSETSALAAAVEAVDEGRVRVRFRFAVERALNRVRFDPVASPGVGQLHRVDWLISGAAGTHAANYAAEELRGIARVSQGVELPADRAGGLAFWAVNGDPQIELTWPMALARTADVAELVVEWSFDPLDPEENDALARSLLDDVAAALPQREPPVASPIDVLLDHVRRLDSRADAANEAQAAALDGQRALDAGIAALSERLAAAQARHDRLDHALDSVAATYSEQRDDLAQVRESQQSFETQLIELRAEYGLLRERLCSAETAMGSLGAVHEQLARIEYGSAEQVALRRRERRRQRLRHWRRQVFAWLDLLRRYRIVCDPAGDLEPLVGAASTGWRATGTDPRFALRWQGPAAPSAGWYLLDIHCRVVGPGSFADPCLYVDYGDGMKEDARIPLNLDPATPGQRCLIKFERDVVALRFDPSTHPCEFELGDFVLRKLSRPEAALRMAGPRLQQLSRSPGALLPALRDAWTVFRNEGASGLEQRLRQLGEASAGRYDYDNWVRCYDTLGEPDRARARALTAAMARRPRFSIVMPVYNTPEQWLVLCIESVRRQIYPDWELCIADDASPSPHVRAILERYAAQDARIKVCFREKNGHIVAASNSALELAGGDYMVLLDHDDELAEHALFLCAHSINENPRLKLIYSDEDKIDEQGRRFDPYFKPDWNPDLFRSHNMISHLGVYATDLVRAVGAFRPGFEGSQDYDLALRCVETLDADEIAHIPHVLYHWRAIPGSTALAFEAKSYARSAGVRALESHFARRGIAASVEETTGGNYRVAYALPENTRPLVSLVIPTRDRVELLSVCVDSLLARTDYPHFEIVVVDNQSQCAETLAYFDRIRSDPRVRVLRYDEPFSFSAINNFAVAHARGEIVGLINNDIEVIDAGWLTEMVSHALRPDIGAVGAMLYYPDDRIQHAGIIVGLGGVAGHAYPGKPRGYPGQMNRARVVQNLSCVTAACLLVRKSVYDEVQGLDEDLRVAFNDVDFCLRIRQRGYRNLWTPWAQLYHHESASRGQEDSPEKLARFNSEVDFMRRRWGDELLRDPAYNPNQALDIESFTLAWPPRVIYPFRGDPRAGEGR